MREKQIVAAARHYLGVPFAHQGRSGAGLDCLGLLVCVANDCALCLDGKPVVRFDETDYGHYPDAAYLRSQLEQVLRPCDEIKAGQVALLHHDGSDRHLAIVGDYGESGVSLIHAYAPARVVVEHRLDENWKGRVAALFEFTEVEA